MPVDLVRDAAIDVLLRVLERDWFLDESLDKTLRRKTGLSPRGKRFLAQLVYGTVRHRILCDHALHAILTQPLAGLPPPIRAILRMGVFQVLFCSQVTFPAMVNTSVELAKRRGHAGTARLVNAVLRRAPKCLEDLRLPAPDADTRGYLSLRYSMPEWLVARWAAEFGLEEAAALCAAFERQAPVTIRANTCRNAPEELLPRLAKAGIHAERHPRIPEALTVIEGKDLPRSKPFREGAFMLQDPASMLPPHLLEPAPGERVLDSCAAPGGKATHLAQLARAGASIVAMDLAPRRLAAIGENLARLGLSRVHVLAADAGRPPFPAETFDAVLLDAPCSGLGTLRRHPDLKYRIDEAAIARLAALQSRLLRTAIRLCKNGGRVVYAVCTFTPEETRGVVRAASEECPVDFEDGPEWMQPWRVETGQYQTRPQDGDLDGFFLTRFRKRS